MDALVDIATRHNLIVVEDAAHALLSSYKGRPLGGFGHLATFSFHETKNIISGEGGALVINDARFIERAEIIWEKGTNRSQFSRGTRGQVHVDGRRFVVPARRAHRGVPLGAARGGRRHHRATTRGVEPVSEPASAIDALGLRTPVIPAECGHNAHLFYLLLPSPVHRHDILSDLNARGVNAVFHYVPLHSSPAGQRYGRAAGPMSVTNDCSARLIRLPLWVGMPGEASQLVVDRLQECVARSAANQESSSTASPTPVRP